MAQPFTQCLKSPPDSSVLPPHALPLLGDLRHRLGGRDKEKEEERAAIQTNEQTALYPLPQTYRHLSPMADRELSYPCNVSKGLDVKHPLAEVLPMPNTARHDTAQHQPSSSRCAFIQYMGKMLVASSFLLLYTTLVTKNTVSALHG